MFGGYGLLGPQVLLCWVSGLLVVCFFWVFFLLRGFGGFLGGFVGVLVFLFLLCFCGWLCFLGRFGFGFGFFVNLLEFLFSCFGSSLLVSRSAFHYPKKKKKKLQDVQSQEGKTAHCS